MKKPELTHARLLETLHYEPSTGVFTWLIPPLRSQVRAGDRAGSAHGRGYWRIMISGKAYFAHRLAWFYVHGEWPSEHIDHKFRDKGDNRISELRESSPAQNQQNIEAAQKNSASGVRGVFWSKASGKWCAKICAGGVHVTLGYSDDLAVAAAMRAQAKAVYHPGYIARGEQ